MTRHKAPPAAFRQLLLWTLWLSPLAAQAVSGDAIDGRVIEEGSGQPVAGAIVAAVWHATLASFVETKSTCYHMESARTDEQGRYHIAAWSTPASLQDLRIRDSYIDFSAYKPGYIWSAQAAPQPGTVMLTPFSGTVAERFRFLSRAKVSCAGTRDSEHNMYRLYAAIADEARAIAATPEQRQAAQHFTRVAEDALINWARPTTHVPPIHNVDPADSYKKEDLLK
jgi:hypothetical protein